MNNIYGSLATFPKYVFFLNLCSFQEFYFVFGQKVPKPSIFFDENRTWRKKMRNKLTFCLLGRIFSGTTLFWEGMVIKFWFELIQIVIFTHNFKILCAVSKVVVFWIVRYNMQRFQLLVFFLQLWNFLFKPKKFNFFSVSAFFRTKTSPWIGNYQRFTFGWKSSESMTRSIWGLHWVYLKKVLNQDPNFQPTMDGQWPLTQGITAGAVFGTLHNHLSAFLI